jgi:hypothetical protein
MSSCSASPAGPYCRRFDAGRLDGVPVHLRSGSDALAVVTAALHVPERFETIALLLDDDRCGRTVAVVAGTRRAEAVIDVVECMADALAGSGGGHLVVATVRPGVGLLPGDTDRWLDASAIAEDRGCTLLDWYVIDHRVACCVPDLLAEAPRW